MKGKDTIYMNNLIRFVIASNNDWVIPADLEERRFAFFDVSPDRVGNRTYFKSIVDEMENGGREAMLHDLLKWDTSSTDLRTTPRTAGLLDQMVHSMSSLQNFWYDIMKSGEFPFKGLGLDGWPAPDRPVSIPRFYDHYVEYSRSIGDRKPLSNSQMGAELRKLCPGIAKTRVVTEGNMSGVRTNAYLFPAIDECRKAFEKIVGITIKWDE